jgi:Domain of unknown function (DUF397)
VQASDGLRWLKSSHSDHRDQCVEVAYASCSALVRDSKAGTVGPTLRFNPTGWRAFLADLGRSAD